MRGRIGASAEVYDLGEGCEVRTHVQEVYKVNRCQKWGSQDPEGIKKGMFECVRFRSKIGRGICGCARIGRDTKSNNRARNQIGLTHSDIKGGGGESQNHKRRDVSRP